MSTLSDIYKEYLQATRGLDTSAQRERERIAREVTVQKGKIEGQRATLQSQLTTILGELKATETMELRKRDLPITKPSPALLAHIAKSRTAVKAQATEYRVELDKLLAELNTAEATALASIASQVRGHQRKIDAWRKETEASYKQYQQAVAKAEADKKAWEAKHYEIRKDEWIEKTEFDKLDKNAKDYLKKYGIAWFNLYYVPAQEWLATTTEAKFKAENIELATGEWISKLDYDKLSPTYQTKLKTGGVDKFNEWLKTHPVEAAVMMPDVKLEGGIYFHGYGIAVPEWLERGVITVGKFLQVDPEQVKGKFLTHKEVVPMPESVMTLLVQSSKIIDAFSPPQPDIDIRKDTLGFLKQAGITAVTWVTPFVYLTKNWNNLSWAERGINFAFDIAICTALLKGFGRTKVSVTGKKPITMGTYKSAWKTVQTDAFKTIQQTCGKSFAGKFKTRIRNIQKAIETGDNARLQIETRKLKLLTIPKDSGLPPGSMEKLATRITDTNIDMLKRQGQLYDDYLKKKPMGDAADTIRGLRTTNTRQLRTALKERTAVKWIIHPSKWATRKPAGVPARVKTTAIAKRPIKPKPTPGIARPVVPKVAYVSKKAKAKRAAKKAAREAEAEAKPKFGLTPLTRAEARAKVQATTSTKVAVRVTTAIATKIAYQEMVAGRTKTQVRVKVLAAVRQLTKVATDLKIRTHLRTRTAPLVRLAIRQATKLLVKVKPRVKFRFRIRIPLPKGKSRLLTKKEALGVIAWKMGFIYKLTYHPYGQEQIVNTREPIPGVVYHRGAGSAMKSIIAKGGRVPSVVMRDMGVVDVVIRTKKGSRKPRITFKSDRRQRTRVTAGISGVR